MRSRRPCSTPNAGAGSTPRGKAEFLERLRQLPIHIEHRPAAWHRQQILPLARAHRRAAYDAAYLELASRKGLPLATSDEDLKAAARVAGVPLVEAQP
jgi:predicted nucleic acid-binding protein